MEDLLHYVWEYKLYTTDKLQTIEGIPLEIIDPGIHNTHAGPDFFNAKIKLGEELWVGNVEIHINSSDWYKHQHHLNKMYNSVILHIVECIDELEVRDQSRRAIPQWIIHIPGEIRKNYLRLRQNDSSVPCVGMIQTIPEIYIRDWMNALLHERLERKADDLKNLLEKYQFDWNEVFYILLARNFGFGINNDAFERLAKSLPLKIILKHQDSSVQTEALFLGQAGLLNEDCENAYYLKLQREYNFLQKKYDLQSLEKHLFRNLRIRPNNFPYIKLIQLSHIIRQGQGLFSRIMKEEELNKLYGFFDLEKDHKLGRQTIDLLIINCLIPILFIYGKHKDDEKYIERAFSLLHTIKAEKNFITSLFRYSGIPIENACDSQALIQLKREYCEKKKCIFCRIGYKLLSKKE